MSPLSATKAHATPFLHVISQFGLERHIYPQIVAAMTAFDGFCFPPETALQRAPPPASGRPYSYITAAEKTGELVAEGLDFDRSILQISFVAVNLTSSSALLRIPLTSLSTVSAKIFEGKGLRPFKHTHTRTAGQFWPMKEGAP